MKKILIIEDDQLVANIYGNKLSVEHFKVEIAADGATGFDLIPKFQPDVVILDLMLPKISGLDLLKKIRAQAGYELLPVIVFSNTYLSNMVQEAWKAGATKCLSKANCTPKQVIEVVRGLITPSSETDSADPQPVATSATTAPRPRLPAQAEAALSEADSDAAFQADLRRSFLDSVPTTINTARAYLREIARNTDEATRIQQLQELYRRIHTLTGNAGIAGVSQMSHLADALEALLKELYEKPASTNASTLRTVASAIDFLGVLLEQARLPDAPDAPQPRPEILVVDDEAISRRAVSYALEKARLPCTSLESPEDAVQLLAERKFDLIFLDVDMPGMNGFELCTKLRTTHRNKSTPVVFVTSLSDFESRANSTMSGGNDLIAKPFLFVELAVKALIYLMRGRIAARQAAVG